MSEAILEPELPIIDPHHHLWDRRAYVSPDGEEHPFMTAIRPAQRYLLDELMADTGSGHNVIATVFLECGAFYKADGPVERRSIGETEFVNGVAAMSASGVYGDFRACAGIVGNVPLLATGDGAKPILEAHMAAGGGRFRGIRNSASWSEDKAVLGPLNRVEAGLYREPRFRDGFRHLAPLGLSFDAWLLEPQLPDAIDLARTFPDTTIVLDHVGTPLGRGSYAGKLEERFPIWRDNIRELAKSPNVVVKLGGLAMAFCSFPSFLAEPRVPSEQLANEWRRYVETCIEAFGAERCMFESNFPVDMGSCTYAVLWNAFKRLASGASDAEKTALFSGTASRTYRLSL
jgi:predicted TIM-barrel fold metal-dependent hydrolase